MRALEEKQPQRKKLGHYYSGNFNLCSNLSVGPPSGFGGRLSTLTPTLGAEFEGRERVSGEGRCEREVWRGEGGEVYRRRRLKPSSRRCIRLEWPLPCGATAHASICMEMRGNHANACSLSPKSTNCTLSPAPGAQPSTHPSADLLLPPTSRRPPPLS